MNQINLDKLLQNPPLTAGSKASVNSGELKLLVGELYTARLQMLSGASQLQVQTPQGQLTVSLSAQQSQQISQQLTQQMGQQLSQQLQVKLSPAANNQLNLSLQAIPSAASSISLSPAQLPAVLSQWLTQQLPQLLNNIASSKATTNSSNQANTVTLPLQLDAKTGQLQLAGATVNSQVILTLTSKELAAFSQLTQQLSTQQLSGQSAQTNNNRQPVQLNITLSQASAPVQLSLQPTGSATMPALPLTAASQQQLLQALVSQLAPMQLTVAADASKIALGQLNISIPPQLASALAQSQATISGANLATNPIGSAGNVPLLLQLQAPATNSGQWQLVMQVATQNQQLTINQSQADRPLSWQAATLKPDGATAAGSSLKPMPALAQLSPEVKAQAWRNLVPLLSQPLMQPNNLPNLPAPLQQLFSQIQQSLPDISKPLAGPAVAAQLAALLQFQPLQSQPNQQTAGGTLALAIQLLLGHLSQKQQTPVNNTPANRLSQLVSQLDAAQAGTALRQLASVSSPLQQSQLATLDAQSQLQQWLLQLPLQQQGQTIMPQLLLEQREADGKSAAQGQKQWQLTMKFDLQQYGNLLAVAKLQEQDLQLQFYTDHNEALRLAQKFLPLLKDRCAAQGLTISQAECQLGKIPDSLLPRHNSLLTVRV